MQEIRDSRAATPTAADGQAALMDMERAAWRYAALRALVAIDCPEQLRGGPRSVTELADRCGAHAPTLRRLLRAVAQTGVLRSVPPDDYELTAAGQALLEGRPSLSLRYTVDPEIWGAFGELTETVRTGEAPFTLRHGSLYDYLATKPELSAVFDALMNVNYEPMAARLADVGGFAAGETVVDVGGGQGTFLAAILKANPGVRGILLDLGRTIPAARDYLTSTGVADRCEFVAGDFFAEVPAGGDAYLLAHIIHNWNDEGAVRILRRIRTVIPPRGRVLVVDLPLPDDDRPHFGKDLDVRLLTLHGGQERSQAQYAALLADAGFRFTGMSELARGECVLTAAPVTD